MTELFEIQQLLKAPKNQWNDHGKYKYRSCEDILDAVKPLLKKLNCVLTITDEIKNIGDSNYCISTVTLKNASEGATVSVNGFAKEAEQQKGMQAAQLSGSTSSYARKYALNGLFLIDDNKDDDTRDLSSPDNSQGKPPVEPTRKTTPSKKQTPKVTPVLVKMAQDLFGKIKMPSKDVCDWIKNVGSRDYNDITIGIAQIQDVIKAQG